MSNVEVVYPLRVIVTEELSDQDREFVTRVCQDERTRYRIIVDANGDHVATGWRAPGIFEMFAAAPDLLEALQRSLNWLASYPGGNANGCYEQARAAIAKATGQ